MHTYHEINLSQCSMVLMKINKFICVKGRAREKEKRGSDEKEQ